MNDTTKKYEYAERGRAQTLPVATIAKLRIKEAILKEGYKQKRLAERMGMTQNQLNYNLDVNRPGRAPLGFFVQMYSFFDLDLNELKQYIK